MGQTTTVVFGEFCRWGVEGGSRHYANATDVTRVRLRSLPDVMGEVSRVFGEAGCSVGGDVGWGGGELGDAFDHIAYGAEGA